MEELKNKIEQLRFDNKTMTKEEIEEHDRRMEERRYKLQLEAEREMIAEAKQARMDNLRETSLMGDKYESASFETTEYSHNPSFHTAMMRCQKYCKVANQVIEKGLGLYLFGDSGTGKTHLVACIANELMKQGYSVLFTNFYEIAKEIKSTFDGNKNTTEQEIVNTIAKVDFLIIDDIGTEKVVYKGEDTFLQEKIYDLINRRYNENKPTIFTSNHTIGGLEKQRNFLHKTVDRIMEMSSLVLKIDGDSYRKKIKKESDLPF